MKTIEDINKTLAAFEKKFGIPARDSKQGSDIWFDVKLGVLSASNASRAVAKKGTETRATYMAELVAQVATGLMEEVNSKAMDWGKSHEDAARSHYEFETGNKMIQLPFVFIDDKFREGCSPDGIVSTTKGAEIKCPFNSVHFIKFVTEEKVKLEYQWQNQFTMRVLGAGEWDAVQYDPRMKDYPMHSITVPRDEEMQKQLDELIPEFISDMDKMLKKLGLKFGDQWLRAEKMKMAK